MEKKYTFKDFLDNLDFTDKVFYSDLANKPCTDKEVIAAINEALPKKYCIVEAETVTDLDMV